MKKLLKPKSAIDQATTNDQVDQGNNNGHSAPIQPETIKNQKLNKQ